MYLLPVKIFEKTGTLILELKLPMLTCRLSRLVVSLAWVNTWALMLGETPTVTVSTSYIRCSTVTAVLGLTGYYCTMSQIANVAPFSLTFHSADTAWFSQVLYLCNLSFSKVGDEVFINELVILAENTGLR